MSTEVADIANVAALSGVTLRYRKTTALHSIDLAIPAARRVGFIGPDGVGKSSLLSLVSGTRAVQEGEVSVLGGDMSSARHRHRVCPEIAYMPQGLGRNLYPTLSVEENLQFFARLFGYGSLAALSKRRTSTEAMTTRPLLLITLGDVAGIGPEIVARSWLDLLPLCRPVVVGDPPWMRRALELVGAPARVGEVRRPDDCEPGPELIPVIAATEQDLSGVEPGKISAAARWKRRLTSAGMRSPCLTFDIVQSAHKRNASHAVDRIQGRLWSPPSSQRR